MATPAVTFNPLPTTNAAGSFSVQSDGLVAGTALDSPNSRYNLAGGVLNTAETVPMWGGVAIYEWVPAVPGNTPLGATVGRAIAQADATKPLSGWAVFDQAHAAIVTSQSPVPLLGSGQSVNFYRTGSGARLCLPIDPTFAATLEGGKVSAQCSWDYTAQQIVAYDSVAALPVRVLQVQLSNNQRVSYNSGTGFATWVDGAVAVVLI